MMASISVIFGPPHSSADADAIFPPSDSENDDLVIRDFVDGSAGVDVQLLLRRRRRSGPPV